MIAADRQNIARAALLANVTAADKIVGCVPSALRAFAQIAFGPPGKIRHDHAEDAARTSNRARPRQRCRNIVATEVLDNSALV